MTNADRQRAYRERKRNAEGVTGVTPPVTERNADTVTALRARVTELEGEVARLKRELATANAREWPGRARPILARAAGDPVGAPKHGPDCHCNPCWLERKAGRARRA